MTSSNVELPQETIDRALNKLLGWKEHHDTMVLYSEAKVLYRTVPWLIDLLELGKKFLDSSAITEDGSLDPDDLYACREFLGLANAILED
jgi:hypothetical protein